MEEKSSYIRKYILNMLDNRQLNTGDRLPAARELAQQTDISLPTVQNAIELLCHEGVLKTEQRRGTFVLAGWNERIIRNTLATFRSQLPWLDDLKTMMQHEFPEIWVTERVKKGIFEVKVSHYVQSHHDDYLDLNGIFQEAFPNTDDFFLKPFDAFRIGRKLIGVPLIYSPRVLFYNPRLMEQAGCVEPYAGWSIEEFMECVRRLRRILPPEDVFFWHPQTFLWMNFVVRAGGSLIDPGAEEPVKLDSPETIKGLTLFREIRKLLDIEEFHWPDQFESNFLDGRAAMLIEPREFMSTVKTSGFKDWATVPLPIIGDGPDCSVMAADVFCVRKECVDTDAAARLLKLVLSPAFQNCMARRNYGIPIRKSVIGRAVDYEDSRDVLFLNEIPKLYPHYNLDNAEIYSLVCEGVHQLLVGNDDIAAGTAELADMIRVCLKIRRRTLSA